MVCLVGGGGRSFVLFSNYQGSSNGFLDCKDIEKHDQKAHTQISQYLGSRLLLVHRRALLSRVLGIRRIDGLRRVRAVARRGVEAWRRSKRAIGRGIWIGGGGRFGGNLVEQIRHKVTG